MEHGPSQNEDYCPTTGSTNNTTIQVYFTMQRHCQYTCEQGGRYIQ